MPERDYRRRITANRWSAVNHSRASRRGRKSWRKSDIVRVLRRTKSEPSVWKSGDMAVAVAIAEKEEEGVLYRPGTCSDIFSYPDNSVPRSPGNRSQRYNGKSKVVINVTVEGSPGPIRSLVKLGSNIYDITKLVVKKSNEEGRTPRLHKDAASTCELHHSHFSLQCLSKSDLIADIGSRSFYLRKHNNNSSNGCLSDDTKTDKSSTSSNQMAILPLPFLPSFINRKMKKIFRTTRKVWMILGCMPCT